MCQTRTRNATGADATAVVRAIRARGTDGVTDEVTNQPVGPVEGRGEEAVAHPADALESDRGADQSLIDSLFGSGAGTAPEALPKGLGAETGRLVLAAVRDAGEVSAAECAEAVGISRVSARRYLEHYLGTGMLEIRLQYGAGRPERRYRSAR